MKITITQLPNDPEKLSATWPGLVTHVQAEQPDIVVLPEMIFSPWLAADKAVDPAQWQAAIESHAAWIARFEELAPAVVLGSRPVLDEGTPYNESFVWDVESGMTPAHRKHYLPNEAGFWEAEWYRSAPIDFRAVDAGAAKVGFMLCTDLWFTEHARGYARQGIHILANPRATELATNDKWPVGGKAAAIMSGAYCVSSNHVGEWAGVHFGGMGWVIDPNGEMLAMTSNEEPFVAVEIDLGVAEAAKGTYPRDVLE